MQESSEQQSALHFLDYWRVIRSRKEIILSVVILIVLTGAAYTFMLPKIYEASTRLSIRADQTDVEVFERQFIQSFNPYFLRTQYEIVQSTRILNKVVQNLGLAEKWGKELGDSGAPLAREDAYRILKKNVHVEQYRDTNLVLIRVRGEDPKEVARIANEVTIVYRDYRLSLKRQEMQRGIEALDNELQKQIDLVNRAEAAVEKLRKDLDINIVNFGVRADKLRLRQVDAERVEARVSMLVRKARLDQMLGLDGSELANAAALVVDDRSIARVSYELSDARVLLKSLLQNYGENHPEVRKVQAAVDELNVRLSDALDGLKAGLRADYEVAKARYAALEAELTDARAMDIAAESEKFLPFEGAQRNAEVQREILNALRARVVQERIELEVPRTPVDVIDLAEEQTRHISPNLFLNILLSLFLGIGAGVGLAYFIEYLDTSVKTVDDVERYLDLSVVGVIPQKVLAFNQEGPESPHAESYRVLRTNIMFNNKGVTGGAFAVVSGGVGEGKSTTLFNLAYVCAQLGDKVLIVDSDLRRPVQHTILGMSNRFGLTNVLMRDASVEEAIKPTSVPNLHFMPSGKLPSTALGLLDSQRMRELVKNLKARYDYVFFDSPPIVGVSDASILSSEVDGVLLVVQYRKYPRTMSSRAKRIIENVGGNLIGCVLNNINILRDDYYYYYHSYSQYAQPPAEQPEALETAAVGSGKEDAV